MKDKKYKSIENVIDDYIRLKDEQIEVPLSITKAKEKYDTFLKNHGNDELNFNDSQDAFKYFSQLQKYEENKNELDEELLEPENVLKEFLETLAGKKISYEKKE